MKSPRHLLCLLALFGGVFFWPGEAVAASKKKKASARTPASRHAPARPVDPAMVREAQNALTELGFYFGAVDGELNEETQGALRRFQAYKGLEKSGAITDPTLTALRTATAEAAAAPRQSALSASMRPAPASPPAPPVAPAPVARATPVAVTTPPPQLLPPSPQRPSASMRQPPSPSPVTMAPPPPPRPVEVSSLLQGTPYGAMPPSAQEEVIRKMQAALARERFYRGAVDGVPTAATEEALIRFQSARRLSISGRADPTTLRALGLLSPARGRASIARQPVAPQPPVVYQPPPSQGGMLGPAGRMTVRRGAARQEEPVYRGRVPRGVVQGAPLEQP